MAIINGNSGNNTLIGTNQPDIISGMPGADYLSGEGSADFLDGGDGPDFLSGGTGRDSINGERGDDILYGGQGADLLTGADGADLFQYRAVSDSTVALKGRDTITDFNPSQGDAIDIRRIDGARASFIGNTAFTGHAGQVDYRFVGGNTVIFGDVNGDKKADYAIELTGIHSLFRSDFLL